jgi:hypothetical protein
MTKLVNPRLPPCLSQIPFGTQRIFRHDAVYPLYLDRIPDLERFIRKGFTVNRQCHFRVGRQCLDLGGVQTGSKDEYLTRPMEPDG